MQLLFILWFFVNYHYNMCSYDPKSCLWKQNRHIYKLKTHNKPQTHHFFCTNSGIFNLFRQIHLMYTYMWHFPVNRIVYFDCKSCFFVCFDPLLWHTSLSRQIWSPAMLIGRDACPFLHFRGDAFRTNRRWAGFLGLFRALLQRAVGELVSSSSLWSREQLRLYLESCSHPRPWDRDAWARQHACDQKRWALRCCSRPRLASCGVTGDSVCCGVTSFSDRLVNLD